MRRGLLVLVGAVVLVDTLFYAALAPLLPALSDDLGLDKSHAGVLVGAYAAGTFVGAIPGGWGAARFGARATVVVGLATMTVAGTVFALGQSAAVLDGARFLQGVGGACSWTAGLAWIVQETDGRRRGEAIGLAIGAAVFGAQLGPVVGAVANWLGRGVTFSATAALGLVLIVWTLRTPEGPGALVVSPNRAVSLLGDRGFRGALWLTLLPSLAFGAIEVLAPLRLDDLGASATAIGAVFFVSAMGEALVSPLAGRVADRRGVLAIVRVAPLVAAVGIALLAVPAHVLVLALVIVLTGTSLGTLWVPGGALVAERSDALEVDQGWAFAFNNAGWAMGVAVGSGAGAALAQAGGDGLAYGIIAALFVATSLAARSRPGRSLRSAA